MLVRDASRCTPRCPHTSLLGLRQRPTSRCGGARLSPGCRERSASRRSSCRARTLVNVASCRRRPCSCSSVPLRARIWWLVYSSGTISATSSPGQICYATGSGRRDGQLWIRGSSFCSETEHAGHLRLWRRPLWLHQTRGLCSRRGIGGRRHDPQVPGNGLSVATIPIDQPAPSAFRCSAALTLFPAEAPRPA